MRFLNKIILLLFFFAGAGLNLYAQQTDSVAVKDTLPIVKDTLPAGDTTPVKDTGKVKALKAGKVKDKYVDSVARKDPRYRNPGKAALRSAILPGWGQVYNKKIWKVPIVYAALGVTGGLFIDNLKWYKRFRYAFTVAYNISQGKDSLTGPNYAKVYDQLKRPFFEGPNGLNTEGLRSNRDQIRQDVDYAFVFFLIAWGLNVVDATVDAHLSTFDVSPKLSFKIQPGYSEMANTSGLSFVLRFK
ncbi:DUF5683 domain-containing protein [Niabella beijingensis]|uniref:DUF5683 domain-containing protein n=1 Tax=Niabella beijingensis TaxID=2872700 RepID=UPI001CC1979E|nr:DUF5683 domain-containing protein [Niabella beijingensis]MBZ4190095.1 hypothetical protein [Niabella beijingensis]